MEKDEKIRDLLKEVSTLVPTMVFIGTTSDKKSVMLIGSSEKDEEQRLLSVAASIATMIDAREDARTAIFSAVSLYLQHNPDYRAKMSDALRMMQKPKGEA